MILCVKLLATVKLLQMSFITVTTLFPVFLLYILLDKHAETSKFDV